MGVLYWVVVTMLCTLLLSSFFSYSLCHYLVFLTRSCSIDGFLLDKSQRMNE